MSLWEVQDHDKLVIRLSSWKANTFLILFHSRLWQVLPVNQAKSTTQKTLN